MTAYPHEKRNSTRTVITQLQAIRTEADDVLEGMSEFSANTLKKLTRLSQTDALDGQLRALDTYLEQTTALHREMLRLASRDDLTAYAEYMNPDEPPARHHIWLCERLHQVASKEMMRLMVSMPPGHAKSTYCTHLFPSWYLGNNPTHKYLQGGHTQTFVEKEFSLRVRNYIERPEFGEIFDGITLSKRSYAMDKWMLSNGKGSYTAKGVGQGISGVRCNISGVDDPIASREDANSPTARKKLMDWFIDDFKTRSLPKSPIFVVATRWHPDDLIGQLEEQNKEGRGIPWEIINLPAIALKDDPLGRPIDEPLWPDFYTLEELNDTKATMSSQAWNSLYMGSPVDVEGGLLDFSKIERYDKLPDLKTVRKITCSADCANKDGQRHDFTVITVWYHCEDGRHYLVDVIRKKVTFNPLVKLINATAVRWNADQIIVEDKGAGTQYIQTQGGGDGEPRKAPAPLLSISTDNKTKEFRFDGVTPMFSAGEVVLPKNAIWLAEYELELLQFPNSKHDDQVDSTSQYLSTVRVKKTKRGTVKAIVGGSGRPNSPAIDVVSERPPPSAKIGGTRTTPPEPVVETPSTPPKKHPKANRATRLHDSSIRRRLGR